MSSLTFLIKELNVLLIAQSNTNDQKRTQFFKSKPRQSTNDKFNSIKNARNNFFIQQGKGLFGFLTLRYDCPIEYQVF